MRCQHTFMQCAHCGNLVGVLFASDVPLICCGEEMRELVPNTVDAAAEKHVPDVQVLKNLVVVNVGSAAHPMTEEHYISWVYLQTERGGQRKCLLPGEAPMALFCLTEEDKPISASAYCNLHGLWKKEF